MMTDEPYDDLIASYLASRDEESRRQMAEAAALISRFTALAATKGVTLGPESFEYIQTTGIVAKAPDIVHALLGPVRRERDGLLSFDEIASRFPTSLHRAGCFVGPDFALMAHPCYRRAMHPANNWAPRFVELFWQFNGPSVERFIALDEDRVRIDVEGSDYFEADTWYGAPFDQDVTSIKPGVVKLRPPLDIEPRHVSFFFANAYCLDVKWSDLNGIKSFQALELKTEDTRLEVGGINYMPARYLHAEFDIAAKRFRHFDGAIQLFTEDEYLQRRDSDFNMTMKNPAHIKARSCKVFKINGALATEDWVELCCHFFAGNPLAYEYFGGCYPRYVDEALEKIRARSVS